MEEVREYKPDKGVRQNFFRIHGRMNCGQYLLRWMLLLTIGFGAGIYWGAFDRDLTAALRAAGAIPYTLVMVWLHLLMLVLPFACVVSWLLITGRRAEDLGYSNWLGIVSCLVPFGAFFLLEAVYPEHTTLITFFICVLLGTPLNFKEGTNGANKYGPKPISG